MHQAIPSKRFPVCDRKLFCEYLVFALVVVKKFVGFCWWCLFCLKWSSTSCSAGTKFEACARPFAFLLFLILIKIFGVCFRYTVLFVICFVYYLSQYETVPVSILIRQLPHFLRIDWVVWSLDFVLLPCLTERCWCGLPGTGMLIWDSRCIWLRATA